MTTTTVHHDASWGNLSTAEHAARGRLNDAHAQRSNYMRYNGPNCVAGEVQRLEANVASAECELLLRTGPTRFQALSAHYAKYWEHETPGPATLSRLPGLNFVKLLTPAQGRSKAENAYERLDAWHDPNVRRPVIVCAAMACDFAAYAGDLNASDPCPACGALSLARDTAFLNL
jgi:hypothetical protein